MSPLRPPPLGEYDVVCPHCKAQDQQVLDADYTNVRCPTCYGKFQVFIATVRAKRQRESRGGREYVIRNITHSGEGVLRFIDYGWSDLDLRSRDVMYVCYKLSEVDEEIVRDNHPYILCNLNTKRYTDIKKLEPPKKTGWCFIATTAYGTVMATELDTLREFRDNKLNRNVLGRQLVEFYYSISPPLADIIARSEGMRALVRLNLNPIIRALKSKRNRKD